MEHFDLDGHIAFVRREYEARMRRMAELLTAQRWPGVTWREPKGGMFFWSADARPAGGERADFMQGQPAADSARGCWALRGIIDGGQA